MRIAVIGLGPVGRMLALGWHQAGHEVHAARRSPNATPESWPDIPITTVERALATEPDIVVLSLPATELYGLVEHHRDSLHGTVLVDTTNALTGPPMVASNFAGPLHQRSVFATLVPTAQHHRAFCSIGWEAMGTPGTTDIPHAGPAATAHIVAELVTSLGQQPWWIGDDEGAFDTLDGVARLWFQLALVRGYGRSLGLQIGD